MFSFHYMLEWIENHENIIICTPEPESMYAAAILASSMPQNNHNHTFEHPSPIMVINPKKQQKDMIDAWQYLDNRRQPKLWAISLTEENYDKISNDDNAFVFIKPDEYMDKPTKSVISFLHNNIDFAFSENAWKNIVKEKSKRLKKLKLMLKETLSEAPTEKNRDKRLSDVLNQKIMPYALPNNILSQIKTHFDYPAGTHHWKKFESELGITDKKWRSNIMTSIQHLSNRSNASNWEIHIKGFSATAALMRARASEMTKRIIKKQPVFMLDHDNNETRRVICYLLVEAGMPIEKAVKVKIKELNAKDLTKEKLQTLTGIYVVSKSEEFDFVRKYEWLTTKTDAKKCFFDIPPLNERSMDIPHIAINLLNRLHHKLKLRGARKSSYLEPEELSWLSTNQWNQGSKELESYLKDCIQKDQSIKMWKQMLKEKNAKQTGIEHPCLGNYKNKISLKTIESQYILFEFGNHTSVKETLLGMNINKNKPPFMNEFPIRRLLQDGTTKIDRWWKDKKN